MKRTEKQKDTFLKIALSTTALIAILQPTIINSLLTLVLFGEVPSTAIVIPAWVMLGVYVLAMGVLTHWALTRLSFRFLLYLRTTRRKKTAANTLPLAKRRRFRHGEAS